MTLLLAFQLAGEGLSRSLALPVPGPVIGMVAMTLCLVLSPRFLALMRPLCEGLLSHLSLLFVPAGVGVIGHLTALGAMGPGLALAIVVSTAVAIAVGALTFTAVAKLTGSEATDD
ncbi:CidA/LrgA family protein [Pseudogemmobacter lacusdianii]|nr:CidA/LrgA family protein [Xinfangfangia sp. CPCC 101601]